MGDNLNAFRRKLAFLRCKEDFSVQSRQKLKTYMFYRQVNTTMVKNSAASCNKIMKIFCIDLSHENNAVESGMITKPADNKLNHILKM